MKLKCIESSTTWFTVGREYSAQDEEPGYVAIMQDDLVSDFAENDAWIAKDKGDHYSILNIAKFAKVIQ